MLCESCNTTDVEIECPNPEGDQPYKLCICCFKRLDSGSLRPLEFYNLVAIHGVTAFLHDDFYDEFGEACQAEVEVEDPESLPFPRFDSVKYDVRKLTDFAIVTQSHFDQAIRYLKQYEPAEVLWALREKVAYNRAMNVYAYPIAAQVLGRFAEKWMREEWEKRQKDKLQVFARPLLACLPAEEAYYMYRDAIDQLEGRAFLENFAWLGDFKNTKTLDWIEAKVPIIQNVIPQWGALAVSSGFDWKRAKQWLEEGRPLSLIALDAIHNIFRDKEEEIFLAQISPDSLCKALLDYLEKDAVPRTKQTVGAIFHYTEHL